MPLDGVPLAVPSGVLHTPRSAGQALSQPGQNGGTGRDKSPAGRMNPRFLRDTCAGQRGTEVSHLGQKSRDSDLLTLLHRLAICYWRGGVTQEAAAKMLGIRKAEFGEYARGLLFVDLIEQAGWRYYLARFSHRFPETDPRAVRTYSLPREMRDSLWRPGRDAPVAEYDGKDAARLSPAQASLATHVGITGTASDPLTVKLMYGNRRPPRDSRPRLDNPEPHLFDEREAMSTDGPEFEFTTEAA